MVSLLQAPGEENGREARKGRIQAVTDTSYVGHLTWIPRRKEQNGGVGWGGGCCRVGRRPLTLGSAAASAGLGVTPFRHQTAMQSAA